MLKLTVLALAEQAINRVLALDATAAKRLQPLQGKVLAVHARAPELSFYVLPSATGLRLASQWLGEVHCSVSARTADLLQLAKAANKTQVLHGQAFVIDGDSGVLLALAAVLQDLELDWQYPLSRSLGPLATSGIDSLLSASAKLGRHSLQSFEQTLADYLSEESRTLVGNREAQYHFTELEHLKLSLERLEARVARLSPSSSCENA